MYDVAIAGGGPAGCAVALALRTHAPALSVAIIEASEYGTPRIGETLSPAAARVIQHLRVWQPFVAQTHRVTHGTAALWGGSYAHDNDFMLAARGTGWHLDRTAFDAMLAAQAEGRGVSVLRDTRVTSAERSASTWSIGVSRGAPLSARFLVDATGSAARIARLAGAKRIMTDRLVGFARLFDEIEAGDPRTIVEAFDDGWWYTAALPRGVRIAVCMTDADVARRLGLDTPDGWSECLASTTHIATMLRAVKPRGPIVARAARSHRLEPAAGADWLAVGDAASTLDPLSSQGIVKALQTGVFAAYAIGDSLARNENGGLDRYRRFVADEFAAYLRTRAKYYGAEQRWPHGAFWRRRHLLTA